MTCKRDKYAQNIKIEKTENRHGKQRDEENTNWQY